MHDSYIKNIEELPLHFIDHGMTPCREKSNSPNRMIEPSSELGHHYPIDHIGFEQLMKPTMKKIVTKKQSDDSYDISLNDMTEKDKFFLI